MGRITPDRAKAILGSKKINVTLDQAKSILEFLRKLAKIAVTKYLEK